jgi:putative acetyltransferase
MAGVLIRDERDADVTAIREVVRAAFAGVAQSNQKEHLLVDRLRESAALAVSLVAEIEGRVVGHVAFSPVTIAGHFCAWYGLAPLSVLPSYQRTGIGSRLVIAGLESLCALHAQGCVLLGEPEYYARFGFVARVNLLLENVTPEYFLARSLSGGYPRGKVAYHPVFALCV